ncbi:RagB/SusD family nutrient uptake outer membrane protein [Mariniphaga sediminis]|uniref:RagB/SusD family nutrient uptake outer membrane protein n=1 Tax=Mariniphaga sediminis TaxID=1628158 RepID=A0A399D0Q3_9BACT|nr:RagB/SusD family nutrient uptake outer membrane protein [Mariniphaga sediminis]RIH63950.1 RagB/SusD family nutrient uptake outer membrane protein [Mariniphaga sediminis]
MKYIKVKKWIAAVAVILVSFTACEDQLEEKPYSFYAVETFFETVNQANMATLGVYDPLAELESYGRNLSMLGDADTDILQMRGTDLNNDRRKMCHYNADPTLGWIQDSWRQLWLGIDRANMVIQEIPEMDLYTNGTEDEIKLLQRYLGEAKFLRGLMYFDLVRIFGAVPLKTTPTKASDDMAIPRASYEELYNQMEQDLTDAAELLPWSSGIPEAGERTNKGAALGLHARVCLARGGYYLDVYEKTRTRVSNYKDYYEKAAQLTKQVMESGEHKLNSSYEQLFRNYCEFKVEPMESMFEIAFFNPEGNNNNAGLIGSYNGPATDKNYIYGRANAFFNTTPLFQATFAENDVRRDVAVADFQVLADGTLKPYPGNKDDLYTPGKWRRNWHVQESKNPNNTDVNWVYLRYADVLLMRAEAENEINDGPNAAAYDAINEVRDRAGLDDLPQGLSKEEFFEALKNERTWELCFEGWRKFDLIRWNMLGDAVRQAEADLLNHRGNYPYVAGSNFDDDKDELWPIPLFDMDENPSLFQNPGF